MTVEEVGQAVLGAIRARALPSICEAGHYRAVDCHDRRPCEDCALRSRCDLVEEEAR
jgi:hypothetical protein